jgi:hypothetical protein
MQKFETRLRSKSNLQNNPLIGQTKECPTCAQVVPALTIGNLEFIFKNPIHPKGDGLGFECCEICKQKVYDHIHDRMMIGKNLRQLRGEKPCCG